MAARPGEAGKLRRPAKARRQALLVLLVAFVSGALAGFATGRVLDRGWPWQEHHPGRHGPARMFAPDGPLGRRLDLSPDQRAEIEAILDQDGAKAKVIFDTMRPQLKALFDSTTREVREVLTPDQRQEFDRYVAERLARLRERMNESDEGHDSPDSPKKGPPAGAATRPPGQN
jgi:Spy/CpxP family protein refolding chaperone